MALILKVTCLKVMIWLGIFVSIAAICLAYFKYAPLLKTASPSWRKRHSELVVWQEEQKRYQRTDSLPDLLQGDGLPWFGGKEEFYRLLESLESRPDAFICGCITRSLELITNHKDRPVSEWKVWGERHKNLSQVEWIKLGFKKQNINIKEPLDNSQARVLLAYVGESVRDREKGIPEYGVYNSLRWLRDNDFRYWNVDFATLSEQDGENVFWGLLRYTNFIGRFPKHSGLGVLPLGRDESFAQNDQPSWLESLYEPDWIFAVFLLGICLIGLRLKKRILVEGAPTDGFVRRLLCRVKSHLATSRNS